MELFPSKDFVSIVGQSFLVNLKFASNGVKMWLMDSILYHFNNPMKYLDWERNATFRKFSNNLISKEEMNHLIMSF
jgi:hypothetical protein